MRILIPYNVFTQFQQLWIDFIIEGQASSIYNAHIKSGLNCMIKEDGMHSFANLFHSAKRKGDIGDSTADATARAFFLVLKIFLELCCQYFSLILLLYLDTPTSLNESYAISVVLFNSSSDCENIGIKNNIIRVKSDSLDQQFVRSLTDFNFAVGISCL